MLLEKPQGNYLLPHKIIHSSVRKGKIGSMAVACSASCSLVNVSLRDVSDLHRLMVFEIQVG